MKKSRSLNIAIFLTLIVVIVKLSIFTLHIQHGPANRYILFFYIFLLIIGVFLGIHYHKKESEKTTLVREDIKAGMRVAAHFSILMAIFIYAYYAFIDPHFFDKEVHEKMLYAFHHMVKNHKTPDYIRKQLKNYFLDMSVLYRPSMYAWGTLLAIMFLSFFDALIIALVMKRLPWYQKN